MLDLGWTEILMIGIVAVVIIGPKDLPKAMHSVAEWMRKLRGMARDFQGQVDDMVKGTELEEVRKAAQGLNKFNVKRQISNVVDPKGQMKKALEETRQAVNQRVDVDTDSAADTSSSGMTTPSLAGDAVAEASIGAGVGSTPRLPAIEAAEPTPADDANAVAAMRGDPPATPGAVPAGRSKAGTKSGSAAGKTASAAGKNGARSAKTANAAKKKSPAVEVTAGKADAAKAKPAMARATGSGPVKARKPASAAKAPQSETAPAAETGAAAKASGPKVNGPNVNGDARLTRKRAPARRKPAGNGAAPDTAAVQDD